MNEILFFAKKPKFKINDLVREVIADNGFFKYYSDFIVYKIKKNKNGYKVYIKEKY